MVSSRFLWIIVLHIAAILVLSVGLGIMLQKQDYLVTVSLLIILLVFSAISLYYYLLRIRHNLIKVIDALKNEDATIRFPANNKDPYFKVIHDSFNDIITNFKLIRLDKERETHFLRAMADHIQFGIIAFDMDGKIEMINESFTNLFKISHPGTLEKLKEGNAKLVDILQNLACEEESLKRILLQGRYFHLLFLASEIRLFNKKIKLISVRDITREIDDNELEAWQKLIRILKHEIVNSLSPIKLMAGTLERKLKKDPKGFTVEEWENFRLALGTILKRANGLSDFMEVYSNLYVVPELNLQTVDVHAILNSVIHLFRDQSEKDSIKMNKNVETDITPFIIDEKLIGQVLINLIKNSIEAMQNCKKKEIRIIAHSDEKYQYIKVKDTGSGIAEEQIESIFLPFYTTKKRGNGVGLSFAQHVMRLHNGSLQVRSEPGKGSEFTLLFK